MIDTSLSLDILNASQKETLAEHLKIEFIEINTEFLKAKMPVENFTSQQLGMLHGGASVSLAESVGGVASYLSLDRENYYCLGLEIKCNHIKSVMDGFVYATACPIHLGTKTHIWQIKILDDLDDLVSISTLTMTILKMNEAMGQKFEKLLKLFP